MDLNEIAVFVKVVEVGSFAGAAKQLDMPKSTVSAKVSALEKRLGTTLIRRTTRKLHITESGSAYYQFCLQGIQKIQAAEDHLASSQGEPSGLLSVTAPIELGKTVLPDVVKEFHKKYPKVRLNLILSDERMDLLSEGIDLAIRAGELKDSTLVVKKLGSDHFAPVASPKYLKNAAVIHSPQDLKKHSCIGFAPLGAEEWRLTNGKSTQILRFSPSLIGNNLTFNRSLALAGFGIALLPISLIQADITNQRLVRILKDWRSSASPIHFAYPSQKFVPPKMNAFIEVATEIIRGHLILVDG